MLASKLSSSVGTNSASANYIEDVFSTYLYTGNGSTQTITNGIDLAGKGGLTWIKVRSTTDVHALFDTNRGALNAIQTQSTTVQSSLPNSLTSFNSNGFSLGSDGSQIVNASGQTFASWTFRKQPKFFDVVTYTGNGATSRNISHNLGSDPGCIIVKRTSGAVSNWSVYHRSTGTGKRLILNQTLAVLTDADMFASVTSTTFSVSGNTDQNDNGETYVAYLFAHNAGGFGLSGTDNVISCGSWSGTGSPVEVNVGFEPQFVLCKTSNSVDTGWMLFDTMRGMSQTSAEMLEANNANMREIGDKMTATATGFINKHFLSASYNWIYIAIRRGPMKVPTSGTSVFAPQSTQGPSSGSASAINPNFTSNFPVDMFIRGYKPGGVANVFPMVLDRLRGGTVRLMTSSNVAEAASNFQFDSQTGVWYPSLGSDSTNNAWMFKRAPSFFDEVCFTVSGSAPVNHNLGVAPELIIYKTRGSADDWWAFADVNGAGQLDSDGAWFSTGSGNGLTNISQVTSTTFKNLNGTFLSAGNTVVTYLFATCAGVSKVGKYTGTGTTKQVDCGFTGGARFVLIKRTDSTGDWYVWDSARGIVAGNDPYLLLNSTAAEVTTTDYIDTYSAGFEISSTAPAAINASGGSFVFLAIA